MGKDGRSDMTEPGRIAAVGMFDGVHLGHQFLIDFMRREGEARGLVPTAFTFSPHPLAVIRPGSHPRLLSTVPARRDLLLEAGAAYVEVIDFDEDTRRLTAAEFLAMLHDRYNVRALVLGFNNHFGSDRPEGVVPYREIGATLGVDVVQAPGYCGGGAPVSSSIIRGRVAAGDVSGAAAGLGRPYSLSGKVVGGKQLGRTIGFPTANIEVESPDLLIPANGVYACEAVLADGSAYAAMTNIGQRPTVDAEGAPVSIEAHLLGYDGDLYGEKLVVRFWERIRDERRFDSVAALRRQLEDDAATTHGMLACYGR